MPLQYLRGYIDFTVCAGKAHIQFTYFALKWDLKEAKQLLAWSDALRWKTLSSVGRYAVMIFP